MLRRLSISAQMLIAFIALLTMMAGIGGFALVKIGQVNALSVEMRTRWLPATQLIGDLHTYTSQYRIAQSVHVGGVTPQEKRKAEIQLKNARSAIEGMLADYRPLLATPEQKALFDDLSKNWAAYGEMTQRMVALSSAGDPAAMDLFNGEALDMFYTVEDSILQLIELNVTGGEATSKASDAIYGESRTLILAALGAALLVALSLSIFLMRTVARPMRSMSEAVERLVEGDMSVDVPGRTRQDELGSLARALESFKDLFAADQQRAVAEQERAAEVQLTIDAIGEGLAALAEGRLTHHVDETANGPLVKLHHNYNAAVAQVRDLLGEIVEGCDVIKVGTNEIAQASSDLSRRTEKQAESLAQTSHTLDQFTNSVKVAADNARQTSERLAIARSSAEQVDQTAKKAVEAMRSIEASSKEMTEIISTIDGLAFQTNLLALNAGVEAARAGDAGKGFAVVASEVRLLAQRSADAASRIRDLVATSGSQVSTGVSLVENSGQELRQILTEVTQVSSLMDEIAGAAENQASGLSEISQMVASMDTVTQQNAAMVEQSTASAHNLSDEMQRLFDQLSFFDLGRRTVDRSVPAAPAPRHASAPKPAMMGNLALKIEDEDWQEF